MVLIFSPGYGTKFVWGKIRDSPFSWVLGCGVWLPARGCQMRRVTRVCIRRTVNYGHHLVRGPHGTRQASGLFPLPRCSLSFRMGFPGGTGGREPTCQCRRCGFHPWVGKIPCRRTRQPYSSALAWRSPWTEEPGGLQSIGSQSGS